MTRIEERSKTVYPINFGNGTADKSLAYALHRRSLTKHGIAFFASLYTLAVPGCTNTKIEWLTPLHEP